MPRELTAGEMRELLRQPDGEPMEPMPFHRLVEEGVIDPAEAVTGSGNARSFTPMAALTAMTHCSLLASAYSKRQARAVSDFVKGLDQSEMEKCFRRHKVWVKVLYFTATGLFTEAEMAAAMRSPRYLEAIEFSELAETPRLSPYGVDLSHNWKITRAAIESLDRLDSERKAAEKKKAVAR